VRSERELARRRRQEGGVGGDTVTPRSRGRAEAQRAGGAKVLRRLPVEHAAGGGGGVRFARAADNTRQSKDWLGKKDAGPCPPTGPCH